MQDNSQNPSNLPPGSIEPMALEGHQAIIPVHRCENCAFAAVLKDDPRRECHAGPPTASAFIVPNPSTPNGLPPVVANSTAFPLVGINQWCGMHKPRILHGQG